ncbi:MAG: enoyl-CoA hydratase/isomerase family protein [Ignavibacterium sp.]|nr:MAG: enoyl-CoA hydratase/isomerase family protein [Ignavibacterium sp.]
MQKLKLEYTHNNSVACIILDDGKGNVLDSIMMGELKNLLNSFRNNNDIKLITFEGAGKHFSFGASVEEHTKANAPAMLKSFHQIFYAITDLAIPTLAKVSGQCLGGGLELALVCNFLFADQSATLGQPEIILGVFPPPASVILPLKIGNAKAEDILLTGRSITAEEGKAIGLINEVFESMEAMETELYKWISESILPKSASSLRYAVRASRVKFNHILRKMLPDVEAMYINELMETEDANEGINSFLEKRKPGWKNC